jgi:hypothetical protein
LGINREGDTPGALAPEIWFSFLRTGEAVPLEGICDHNRRDIAGLAALFAAFCRIAAAPCAAAPGLAVDIERLALRWRDFTRRKAARRVTAGNNPPVGDDWQALRDTGAALLRHAAETGHPLAALRYALDLLQEDAADEGRGRLAAIAESDGAAYPMDIRIAALRSLSIDSEWRLGDAAEALLLAQRALELLPPGQARRNEFERRQERLMRKTLRGR